MGYFDGLTAASFKQDAEGRELFFLFGKLGKGRIIPSEADGVWVRRYLKLYYIGILVAIVPMLMISGEPMQSRWLLTLCVFLLLALAALIPVWSRTRTWPGTGERLTYGEAVSASAKAHGVVSLSVLVVLSVLLAAGCLFVALYTDRAMVGTMGVLFFGGCLAVSIWMLCARRRG